MLRNGFIGAPLEHGAAPSLFVVVALALAVSAAVLVPSSLRAEDVPFSPRKDAEQPRTKRQEEAPAREMYSYARYEGLLRPLCRAMRPDGHVDRLLEGAEAVLRQESGCQSCRAFARAVDVACREFGSKAEEQKSKSAQAAKRKKLTPTPVPAESQGDESAVDGGGQSGQSPEEQPEAAVTRQRLPSSLVVELASHLSTRLQSDEPGPEPTLKALNVLLQRVLASPGLSRTEHDYFEALGDYLISAWQGRPEADSGSGHPGAAH